MLTAREHPSQLDRPTTASTRRTAVFVGLLFLFATASVIAANVLNTSALSRPDLLTGADIGTGSLGTGAVLLAGQFGVVGIAVLLFPVLKRHGESLALAHVGFRVAELAASLFYLSVPLLVLQLQAGVRDGTVQAPDTPTLAALMQAQYSVSILLIYLVTTAAGMGLSTLAADLREHP